LYLNSYSLLATVSKSEFIQIHRTRGLTSLTESAVIRLPSKSTAPSDMTIIFSLWPNFRSWQCKQHMASNHEYTHCTSLHHKMYLSPAKLLQKQGSDTRVRTQKNPVGFFGYTHLKKPPQKNSHFYFNLILVYTLYATNNAIFHCF